MLENIPSVQDVPEVSSPIMTIPHVTPPQRAGFGAIHIEEDRDMLKSASVTTLMENPSEDETLICDSCQ